MNTVAEATELVRSIDHPNLKTMIDCSAAGLTEQESIPALIDRWLPTGLIAHLQANDPNRRGPGQGEMKFAPILAALKRHDYPAPSRSNRSTIRLTAPAPRPSPPAICAACSRLPVEGVASSFETRARAHSSEFGSKCDQ